jgi:hypothetical protein
MNSNPATLLRILQGSGLPAFRSSYATPEQSAEVDRQQAQADQRAREEAAKFRAAIVQYPELMAWVRSRRHSNDPAWRPIVEQLERQLADKERAERSSYNVAGPAATRDFFAGQSQDGGHTSM